LFKKKNFCERRKIFVKEKNCSKGEFCEKRTFLAKRDIFGKKGKYIFGKTGKFLVEIENCG